MIIGEIFRYNKSYSPFENFVDGYPNFNTQTYLEGFSKAQLESGINPIGKINAPEGLRTPSILISSSPHKIGSYETPWNDVFDPDNGFIKYFGDNKSNQSDPSTTRGNKRLLEAYQHHSSPDQAVRNVSIPLSFFRRVPINGRVKGYVQFQGFGIIEKVELITQLNKDNEPFSNYVFYCAVLSLASEQENFNWEWINLRRNKRVKLEETLRYAPRSWVGWLRDGPDYIERYKRRVSKLHVVRRSDQLLPESSKKMNVLESIYEYYKHRRARFELLAASVAEHMLNKSGNKYRFGWVTLPSGDHGADFVGCLEIGEGFSAVKLIVLGQAKCEKLNSPTNGNHIARTVARLKRGWIGIYVTTSFFSEPVQQEIIEDRYPIILINGSKLSSEVLEMMIEQGYSDVKDFLRDIDSRYKESVSPQRPEQILTG